jgi:hypothetical protein
MYIPPPIAEDVKDHRCANRVRPISERNARGVA